MRRVLLLALCASCGGGQMMYARSPEMASPRPFAERADVNTEDYKDWGKNPWIDAATHPLSTFAADVDTASYTIARRKLNEGELPPPASVRVEEFVNYFKYGFPAAESSTPFSAVIDAVRH